MDVTATLSIVSSAVPVGRLLNCDSYSFGENLCGCWPERFAADFTADSEFIHRFGDRVSTGCFEFVAMLKLLSNLRGSVDRVRFLMNLRDRGTNAISPPGPLTLRTIPPVVET